MNIEKVGHGNEILRHCEMISLSLQIRLEVLCPNISPPPVSDFSLQLGPCDPK